MPSFMYLIRNDHNPMDALGDAEKAEIMGHWGTWMGGLAEQGRLQGGNPFGAAGAVLHTPARPVPGPYGKDHFTVRGYLILNAENLEEAIELGGACPAFRESGIVEIHEIMDMAALHED